MSDKTEENKNKNKVNEENKDENKKKFSCMICLEDYYSDSKDIIWTPCIHGFHEKCIMQYVETKKIFLNIPCPLCKTDISPILGYRDPTQLYHDDEPIENILATSTETKDRGNIIRETIINYEPTDNDIEHKIIFNRGLIRRSYNDISFAENNIDVGYITNLMQRGRHNEISISVPNFLVNTDQDFNNVIIDDNVIVNVEGIENDENINRENENINRENLENINDIFLASISEILDEL